MRRLIGFVLLFALAHLAQGQTFVQAKRNHVANGAGAITLSFNALPTAHNSIICQASGNSNYVAGRSGSDNQTGSPNTYTLDFANSTADPNFATWQVTFHVNNITVNSGTFVITYDQHTANQTDLDCSEWNGGTFAYDTSSVAATTHCGDGSSQTIGPTASLAGANSAIFTLMSCRSDVQAPSFATPTSSYSILDSVFLGTAVCCSNSPTGFFYKTVSVNTAVSAAYNPWSSPANSRTTSGMVSIYAYTFTAGGGATGNVLPMFP